MAMGWGPRDALGLTWTQVRWWQAGVLEILPRRKGDA